MLGRGLDHLFKKIWSHEDVLRYVGEYRGAYQTYAESEEVRSLAASGGTTSALLIHGLENGDFDGAVVCETVIEQGKVRPQFSIATRASQVLAARGSKYVETRFLAEVVPLIQNFSGRVAVVGLPCDIAGLARSCAKDPALAEKVAVTVALMCGHNSRAELIDNITSRLEREAGSSIARYRFRIGHWRGKLVAEFEDGTVLSKPTKFFNDYQNLYFFCQRKCLSCHDHYGYHSDLSVGDIWTYKLKMDPIKYTGLIARTERGHCLFNRAIGTGDVFSKELDIREIMDGQSRVGPFHYNVSARSKAGKLFGIRIEDKVHQKVRWNEFLNAFITLLNFKISNLKFGKRVIFNIPRSLLRLSLYFKKLLESF